MDEWIVADRTGEVIDRDVEAGAVVNERVDLGIGLGARQIGVQRGDSFSPPFPPSSM
jgi:hypothetical protein